MERQLTALKVPVSDNPLILVDGTLSLSFLNNPCSILLKARCWTRQAFGFPLKEL